MKNINLLSILLFSILVIVVFSTWFTSPIIAYGDNWYYFKSMYSNHFLYPYAWYKLTGVGGLGSQGFPFIHTNLIAGFLLGVAKSAGLYWHDVLRVVLYGGYLLTSISVSFFVSLRLLPGNKFWIIAPLIFLFNTYILMTLSGGLVIIAFAYSLIPLVLYFYFRLLENSDFSIKSNINYLLGLSLLLAAQAFLDLRIAYVTAVGIFVYLIISLIFKFKFNKIILFLIPFIIVLLINSYWLLPIIMGGVNPIQELGADYSSKDILEFLSFAKLENTFSLLHPYWPENIFGKISFLNPAFILLPIIAFSSLLFINKKRKDAMMILYFVIIGLLGIFLAKGANYPLGNLYVWMFENVPGFQLFRDSFKWYMLIIISFMFLIPYSLNELSLLISKKYKFRFAWLALFVLFFVYFLFLIKPAIFNELPGTFHKRDVPIEYSMLDEYLSDDESFFRVLWVPNAMLFSHYTNQHPLISGRDFYQDYNLDSLSSIVASASSEKLLSDASVKYVIVPEDTDGQMYLTDRKYDDQLYQEVVNTLDKSSYLERVNKFGKIVVYKTPEQKDQFWTVNESNIKHEFVNPTLYRVSIENLSRDNVLVFSEAFDPGWVAINADIQFETEVYNEKFNSFTLPDGDIELEINYKPQRYVDVGIKISVVVILAVILTLIVLNVKKKHKKN